jgi:hypothetical protein
MDTVANGGGTLTAFTGGYVVARMAERRVEVVASLALDEFERRCPKRCANAL